MVAFRAIVKRLLSEIGDFCLKRGYVALTIIANLTVACAAVNDVIDNTRNSVAGSSRTKSPAHNIEPRFHPSCYSG